MSHHEHLLLCDAGDDFIENVLHVSDVGREARPVMFNQGRKAARISCMS